MKKIEITEELAGERLDKTLAVLFPEYSRSSIEKLIETGDVTVNDSAAKTKYSVKTGDIITVSFHELDKDPEQIDLPIIYEDENVVVINKPVGVLAHTKGAFSKEGTVASWLKERVMTAGTSEPEFWESNRAGIVHRLDRATSGVMICAKNEAAQSHLGKQFSSRNVKKTYIAVVSGTLPQQNGLIDVPIERNPKKPATFRAGPNGKDAQTRFNVLKQWEVEAAVQQSRALVELKPHTGRTHQLRVHMAYLGCPILGDEFYKGVDSPRLMLHAQALEITIPGGLRKTLHADAPAAFNENSENAQ